jgi:hypothetical protein
VLDALGVLAVHVQPITASVLLMGFLRKIARGETQQHLQIQRAREEPAGRRGSDDAPLEIACCCPCWGSRVHPKDVEATHEPPDARGGEPPRTQPPPPGQGQGEEEEEEMPPISCFQLLMEIMAATGSGQLIEEQVMDLRQQLRQEQEQQELQRQQQEQEELNRAQAVGGGGGPPPPPAQSALEVVAIAPQPKTTKKQADRILKAARALSEEIMYVLKDLAPCAPVHSSMKGAVAPGAQLMGALMML